MPEKHHEKFNICYRNSILVFPYSMRLLWVHILLDVRIFFESFIVFKRRWLIIASNFFSPIFVWMSKKKKKIRKRKWHIQLFACQLLFLFFKYNIFLLFWINKMSTVQHQRLKIVTIEVHYIHNLWIHGMVYRNKFANKLMFSCDPIFVLKVLLHFSILTPHNPSFSGSLSYTWQNSETFFSLRSNQWILLDHLPIHIFA